MSDPVSQNMRELLEKMAANLGNSQASPFAHEIGTRSSSATDHVSRSSSGNRVESDNEVTEYFSVLLDNQFRALEQRTLNPLRSVVKRLEERCGRIEAILQEHSETKTVTVDLQQNGNKPPTSFILPTSVTASRKSATSASIPSARQGEKLTRREMKQAAELLNRINRIAPTIEDFSAAFPSHPANVESAPHHESRSRRQAASSDIASSWSGGSSPDSDSETGDDVDYECGAKYDARDMPEDTEARDRKRGNGTATEKVDVDKDPAAIRTLQPRPCHQ
ncbi:hypothetical protein QFC20_000887 [Naganishia adeliensis]|uniref:Uncharacterized protein n=1 Tax=Naganishia adeliensis TaxID=92952 RepID=A0ACC2WYH4_9TREE|nr:hypothetical protein QFC20_000887 [Naganishia adeliensis]